MLRQRLISEKYTPWQSTPRSSYQHNLKLESPILSEWKLAVIGLVVSLLVIASKLFIANKDDIKQFMVDRRLFSIEMLNEDGNVMYQHAWKNVVKYSNIWFPVVCGALTTYFIWLMVYLDSHVPGVQPPSPFSPTKYKTRSGHSFHLNYVFAVIIGLLVAVYMYWRNICIEYF